MLEAKNLSFSYDEETQVLKSCNIQIRSGEIVVLAGPTGSGKSTLAKCLSGFIPRSIDGVFSGSIFIDDKDATNLSISEISRLVSLVQQDSESQICTLNVADEVAFGPENYEFEEKNIENLVESSLSAVNISHLRNRITHTLSGGEKQRLAIAAMLSCQPQYLILDEPSANLDPKGILLLRTILTELKNRGVGILCIEHNIDAIRPVADRILLISEGAVTDSNQIQVQESFNKGPIDALEDTPLLTLEGVNFSYGLVHVLQNISLTLYQREIVALMGENGSGKTTLVSLLGGLLHPDNGSIALGRVSISDIDRKEIAKRVSVVFQNPNHQIFERTVWKEQILTSEILNELHENRIQRSKSLLAAANLEDFLFKNPFSLSHGQKRRLNVTAAISHKPRILLLDEPFVGQDSEGREFITSIIEKTAQANGAVVVVTHNPIFAKKHCNRIIFVENGKILLDGTPENVLEQLHEMGHNEYSTVEVNN